MKNFTKSLDAIADIDKAYAKELVPCPDGSMADPNIGCVKMPNGIVNSDTNLTEVVLKFADIGMSIVMVLCVILLIWSGVIYATAAGDSIKTGKAKRMIMWSVVGLAVAFWARIIVGLIVS